MRLLELIHGRLVVPDLKSVNKWDVIEEMVDHLVAEGEITRENRSTVLDALVAREKSKSTGMSDNVAIPHAATGAVRQTIGLLGISRKGIPFDSLDDQDAKIFCLLVYPQNTFQRHVRTLAGIARLMFDPRFRHDLIHAGTAEEIVGVVRRQEEDSAPNP